MCLLCKIGFQFTKVHKTSYTSKFLSEMRHELITKNIWGRITATPDDHTTWFVS